MNLGKHNKLMKIVDWLNCRFTRNNLYLAIQCGQRTWKLKQEQLSPCYTTKLNEIIKIKT